MKNIGFPETSFAVLTEAAGRLLSERGAAEPLALCCALDPGMKDDAYRFADGTLRAGGVSGLFAGVGAYLRRARFDGRGGFAPDGAPFERAPVSPIHGMYFASHFHNFYHDAPIERVYEVVDELALRGCNALMAWYDMHHYAGVDDPESLSMIARLKAIWRRAKTDGMKLVFGTLSNEAFSGTPDALKAEWRAVNGYKAAPQGHYHVEICPSAPGGTELILSERREVLRAFSDIPFDYISYWPYDQGGCTCAKCKPWGANGFLKLLPKYYEVAREEMPGARLLLSTWYFDLFIDGEWDAFYDAVGDAPPEGVDFLFGYFFGPLPAPERMRKGIYPGGLSMISFPEISMYGATPWGGFGANATPALFAEREARDRALYVGSLPYSEGIFDDANKFLMLYYAEGRGTDAREAMREYARFEFCVGGSLAERVVDLLYGMEKALPRTKTGDGFVIGDPSACAKWAREADEIDALLSERARMSWKWRIIYLRAKIDGCLAASGGAITEEADAYFAELERIYCAENAQPFVAPPRRRA